MAAAESCGHLCYCCRCWWCWCWLAMSALFVYLIAGQLEVVAGQRTAIDTAFIEFYRPLRALFHNALSNFSGSNNIRNLEYRKKLQNSGVEFSRKIRFCDARYGAGRRSVQVPSSVHELRPGDIDIIGGLGDSLTAGTAILGTTLLDNLKDNRGISWSAGGQGNWTQYFTLPNILKEFNPNLYGYATADGPTTDRSSRFNVAELGAFSSDMPYMAKVLVKRMIHDPKVDMQLHWKLVTLLIGSNDFCSDVCYHSDPMKCIDKHENDIVQTLRYLRDNVPRLMVNMIPAPNLITLSQLRGIPAICNITLKFECPCIVGRSKVQMAFMNELMDSWAARDREIIDRSEFNTDTFTVNMQPLKAQDVHFTFPNGSNDNSLVSEDCFHLSQKGQAKSALIYWNNMMRLSSEKGQINANVGMEMLCPSERRPYLITRINEINQR